VTRTRRYGPRPRLASIVYTARTEGIAWGLRRLRYRTPATRLGRTIHSWLRRLLRTWLGRGRPRHDRALFAAATSETLYAFFDLEVAAISFDSAWFAVAADLARRQRGLPHVHFVIVPGRKNGVREERAAYEAIVDEGTRLWRLSNVVVPVFSLVPAAKGYTVLPSRAAAKWLRAAVGDAVYPDYYEPSLPVAHHPADVLAAARSGMGPLGVLRGPPQAFKYIERWLQPRLRGRHLITITLRQYPFMTARNSNVFAWADFARSLDPAKYFPVFLLDTEHTLDLPPAVIADCELFPEASWNVWLRMALYERAYLNLGVNGGPLFMAALNELVRVLIFKIVTPGVPQADAQFLRQLGFEIGGQLPFASQFQKLVWSDDTLETITKEFASMVAIIEAAVPANGRSEYAGTQATSLRG
jgi:hypothetical protein